MIGPEAERPLSDAIVALSGSPDDISGIDGMLVQVASLAVALIDPVNYASITAQRDGAATAVALSNQIALSIDEAQYAEKAGPCPEALDTGAPINTVIATTNHGVAQFPQSRKGPRRPSLFVHSPVRWQWPTRRVTEPVLT
jgi:hypothetical protein